MDLVTHLLASYTLGRAARARIRSPQMAVVLLAGLAPDLDALWHLPAPLSAMRACGTAAHSLVGAGALAVAIAAGVWAVSRKRGRVPPSVPPGLAALLAPAFAAAGLHLLLDIATSTGIEPWWPFSITRAAWNLTATFDVVLILLLLFFAFLAPLIAMVKEEIGAGSDPLPSRVWPMAALALAGAWFGAREVLHHRAEHTLGTAQYLGRTPLHWAAFPAGTSPFRWHGLVETDLFLAEVEVALESGQRFSPESAAIHYKPDPSPLVDATAAAPLARAYTALASFPILTVESSPDGARAELHELGDSLLHTHDGSWIALITLDAQSHVTGQELFYVHSKSY